MKVCYAEQMRNIDRAAMEKAGIPGIVLMENAAIACVNELKNDITNPEKVLIFCGKGNNGGDGFAVARHLFNAGIDTEVFLVCGDGIGGDAKINLDIISGMNVPVRNADYTLKELALIIKSADVVIDAIYGTGIHGEIQGFPAEVIRCINENAKYVLSVDIPSGINADTGEICGVCVNANKTVTFAAYKLGMLMFPGADYTGDVVVSPISIPDYIIEEQSISINIADKAFVERNYPCRTKNSQKSNYGKIFIIAGSKGMSGAAYLSSQAALYGGAGLVTVGVCESISSAMEVKTTEAMTLVLDDTDGHIAYTAEMEILKQLDKSDVVLIGPGLGRSREAARIVKTVLTQSKVPVIADADALYAIAMDIDMLKNCNCPVILTPHEMEMARLADKGVEYIAANRIDISRSFCEEYGVTLILKGHHTIVTSPELKQYINITGNPGMATGGSGDVLAGLIAALTARITDPSTAAAIAVRLHGEAGDKAAQRHGMDAMTALDILEGLHI